MPGSNDAQALERHLVTRLKADPAVAALVGTRVFVGLAPGGTAFPLVLLNLNTGRVRSVAGGGGRTHSTVTYAVQAVVQEGSYADADAVLQAVDAVLTADTFGGTVTLGGVTHHVGPGTAVSLVRQVGAQDGRQLRYAGALYRFFVYGP